MRARIYSWGFPLRGYLDTSRDALNRTAQYVYGIASYSFSLFKAATIGDLYEIVTQRADFVTTVLYQRSKLTGVGIGHFGPAWQNWLPKMVVVSGKESNILKVANYGEEDPKNIDRAARSIFGGTAKLVAGKETIAGMYGEDAQKMRRKLKRYMSEPEALKDIHAYTCDFTHHCLENWRTDKSYQDNITYLTANVIGYCVLGIPRVEIDEVPVLRDFDTLVVKGDFRSREFLEMKDKFVVMGNRLLSQSPQEIYDSQKMIYDLVHFDLVDSKQITDKEELKKLVIESKGTAALFTTGNLGMLLMGAMVYISQDNEIKSRLREELAANPDWRNNWEILNKLHYLNCVYLEAVRFLSPTSVIPRKTSRPFELVVEGKDKIKRSYNIPSHSMLFGAIRCVNNDPDYWHNPRTFNPSRFETEQGKKYQATASSDYFVPFSTGNRLCPAGAKFVPMAFKSFVAEFISQFDLTLDKPIEEIPTHAANPRWEQEYFATLNKITESNHAKLHFKQTP